MREIKLQPGEHLTSAAVKLSALAPAKCTFNGVTLVARKGTTPEALVAYYNEESERRAERWRESPEGRAYAAERRERQRSLQAKADSLMLRLPRLDFADLSAVLDWLSEMEEPRDHVGVTVDVPRLVAEFTSRGYAPGVNCDTAFDADDPDNFARWIIGQAIKEPYYPGVRRFTEEWRKKFGRR